MLGVRHRPAACDDGGVAIRPFVLASASPARLRLLRAAGLDPVVVVSGVDETLVAATDPAGIAGELAGRKAEAVASGGSIPDGSLVLGCDSVLDIDGVALGKPDSPGDAVARWRAMRGRTGALHTGHHLVDTAERRAASAVATTVVRFGEPTDDEIDAYVATGEPLAVAGAFTLDGRSAPFVESVDGDPGNVIGVSLPLVRRLLGELGVGIVELWS